MKKIISTQAIALVVLLLICTQGRSQVKSYQHRDMEFIFSFMRYQSNPASVSTIPRFSCFLHFGQFYDLDFSDNFGIYTGMTLRNIGFTAENNTTDIKKKFRTYAIGIPLAMKLGSFSDQFYFYGGAEYELFFHYKEKTFVNGNKSQYTEWFSNKVPTFMPSVFVGIQFPKGMTLKFQYMLKDFLKTENLDPLVNYNTQFGIPNGPLFYVSLAFTDFDKMLKKKDANTKNVLYSMRNN